MNSDDERAWGAFVAEFQPLIARSIQRVLCVRGSSGGALVDDLVQETFLRLCRDQFRAMRSFRPTHDEAIFGYLKVIAISVAKDYLRARGAEKRRSEVEQDGTEPEPGTSSQYIEQELLIRELDRRLLASESERDRTIFWLYYREGFTAKDIASMPGLGLSQKGVESCLYRLTQLLRSAVQSPSGPKGISTGKPLGVMK